MRWQLLVLMAAAACAGEKREVGVDVFADDTLPAMFTVELTGKLEVGLRSENFYLRPDKTLVLQTPASLVIQKGSGTMLIKSLAANRRIAVAPIGTPPDSSEALAAVGTVVKLERAGEEKRYKLAGEKK